MFYTVYQTTCLVNGKTYIGVHKTTNPNDSYLGSGVAFSNAVRKYGKENFKKEVLFVFDNPEEMLAKECELVVVDPEKTYNLDRGGSAGFGAMDPEKHKRIAGLSGKNSARKMWDRYHSDLTFRSKMNELFRAAQPKAVEAAKSDLAREKRKTSLTEIQHQQREKNSQFGTCWINKEGSVLKIKKDELESFISKGFSLGRGSEFKLQMKEKSKSTHGETDITGAF